MAGRAPLGVPGVRFHRVLRREQAGPLPRGARGLAKSAVMERRDRWHESPRSAGTEAF